jgi:tetratricopeptide repeat protein
MNSAVNSFRDSLLRGAARQRAAGYAPPCRVIRATVLFLVQAAFLSLAVIFLAFPSRAQRLGYPGRGGPDYGAAGGPLIGSRVPPDSNSNSLSPNNPSAAKRAGFGDESCLPWNVSAGTASAVSVTRLAIPPNARGEYQKACDANNKNKFAEAERYTRSAIDKFQKYSAAWVMLGMVLEEQNKRPQALQACEHAVTIDPTYLPAYLCQAEFSARSREWDKVLKLADLAASLNPAGDAYTDYYRAAALFRMKNLDAAKKSALEASDADVKHENVPLYFLLAQIYRAEGNKPDAAAQLHLILTLHVDPRQEDAARKLLAELEPQPQADTK